MAFTVILYSFSKKENSTALPSDGGTAFNCVLKHESSIIEPTISLDIGTDYAPLYNYAYIPAYKRYYFITEWTWIENRLWSADMRVDVLATYKSEIGSSSLYVVRCASTYDGSVVDDLYPITANVTSQRQLVHREKEAGAGSYILNLFGSQSSDTGMLNMYVLNSAQFQRFKEYLFNDDVSTPSNNPLYQLAQEIGDSLSKSVINPMQYIASCTWFPYDIVPSSTVQYIKCGYFNIDMSSVGAGVLNNFNANILANSGSVILPKHPKAGSKGTYLNLFPYTRYSFFMHPYGAIDLDTSLLAETSVLTFNEWIDLVTGMGILTISGDRGIICHRSAQVGVNIALSQSGIDFVKLVSDTGLAVAAGMAGDSATYFMAVGSAVGSINGNSMSMGSTSGSAGYRIQPYLTAYHYDITDENLPEHGRPLMSMRQINTLSGYIEVDHGDIATAGTADENSEIKSFLERGFYYE